MPMFAEHKGPFTNDVSLIFGLFDPSLNLVSTKFTQPPFLWSEFSQPLPSPSGQTSYVHTPKLGSFMALTNNNACILKVVFLVGQSVEGEFQDAIEVKHLHI